MNHKVWLYQGTHVSERHSLRDLKYQTHLYIECTKTLTAPKHQPHRYTDSAGPKGQLVYGIFMPFLAYRDILRPVGPKYIPIY